MQVEPRKTIAVLVGIGNYRAGSDWDLEGPAQDAASIAEWLEVRGVPRKQILLYSSPPTPGWDSKEPLQNLIQKALVEDLQKDDCDHLVFYWSGHGVVDENEQRLLFYADAKPGNLVTLDLPRALTILRSTRYASLKRQTVMVDTCANYV